MAWKLASDCAGPRPPWWRRGIIVVGDGVVVVVEVLCDGGFVGGSGEGVGVVGGLGWVVGGGDVGGGLMVVEVEVRGAGAGRLGGSGGRSLVSLDEREALEGFCSGMAMFEGLVVASLLLSVSSSSLSEGSRSRKSVGTESLVSGVA